MRFDPRVELVLLSAGWFPDRWSGLALAKVAADFESSSRSLPRYALRFFAEFAGLSLRFPNPRDPQSTTGVNIGSGAENLHPLSLARYCREAGEDLCVVGLGTSGSTGFYLLGESGALYAAWDDISLLGPNLAEGLHRLVTARYFVRSPLRPAVRPGRPTTSPRPSRLHRLPTRRRWSAHRRMPSDAATLGAPVHARIAVTGAEAFAEAESLADWLRTAPGPLDVRLARRAQRPGEPGSVLNTLSVVLHEVDGDMALARALSSWFRWEAPSAVLLTVHRAGTTPVEISARQAHNGDIEALMCERSSGRRL
ncbi:SUKH-3 domain-containing protein [Kitasatospora sp. NPDC056531]|uniref:effector-associated constant component EACC1 n=1 Tax=Kitasatospora sp. NPDC056531 TaxID=3345856 RepID=UPI003677CF95